MLTEISKEFIENAEIRENTLAVKYNSGKLEIVGKLFVETEVTAVGAELRQFMRETEGDAYQQNFIIDEWVENTFNDTAKPLLLDIDPEQVVGFISNMSAKEIDTMRYSIQFNVEFEQHVGTAT